MRVSKIAKFHIRNDKISYCRKVSDGVERYKRMNPLNDPHCDIKEHYDSYEEAYRALQKQKGIEFSLTPTDIDPETRKKYDEFWKGQFTYFGEIDDDPKENYDYAEVSMGVYESSVTYFFKFNGERVFFTYEDYYCSKEVKVDDWDCNDFVDISTQIELNDNTTYLEELSEALLSAYNMKFEHVWYII